MSDKQQIDPAMVSVWRLTWRRFRRHRVALVSLWVIIFLYLMAAFADFLATGDPRTTHSRLSFLPPQTIRWFDDGTFRPHVLGVVVKRDRTTLRRTYYLDPSKKIPVYFFARGFEYRLLGIISSNRHLLGLQATPSRDNIFLLCTDRL